MREALVAWAESFPASAHFDLDAMASFLGAPDPTSREPIPADLLGRRLPAALRWRVAAELARHGVRPGLDALVEIVAGLASLPPDDAADVARALNSVVARPLIEVTDGGGRKSIAGGVRHIVRFRDDPGVVKEPAAAAAAVRAWWEASFDRARFDVAEKRWVTDR